MAIEGISSAVNMNSTPVRRQTAGQTEVSAASSAGASGQLRVDSVKPVEARGNASGNKSWEDKKEDKAAVKSDKEIVPEKVKEAVDDLNKQIKQNNKHTNLSFKYHDETNRISITIKDSETDEVIKEIPPEKALDMLAKAWEMAGLLVDEKR